MQELFSRKTKKFIGIAALACFLTTPLGYTVSLNSADAAALDNKPAVEQRDDKNKPPVQPSNDNKKDIDKKDKQNPPPAPPSNDDKKDKQNPPPAPPPNDGKEDIDKKNKQDPPPPPRDGKDNDGKDYDKSDITTAVLVGGVVGAVIAKNT